ncbi:MAG: hypothetical protein QRY74_03375 [Chlamydia sp.]
MNRPLRQNPLFYPCILSFLIHGALIISACIGVQFAPKKSATRRLSVATIALHPTRSTRKNSSAGNPVPSSGISQEKSGESRASGLAQKVPITTKQEIAKQPVKNQKAKIAESTTAAAAPPSKKNSLKKASSTASTKNATSTQSYLDEALSHLNRSSSSTQKNSGNISRNSGTRGPYAAKATTEIPTIGTLESESIEEKSDRSSMATDTIRELSKEDWYVHDLIRKIRLSIRLKEPGVVRLFLTLKRDGTCIKIAILEASSDRSKKELEKSLSSVKYSSFGSSFQGEKEHTFRIKLEDDGNY